MYTVKRVLQCISVLSLGLLSLSLLGCGGSEETLRDDLVGLEQRIGDLERGAGRTHAQLNSLEQDVLLLEDRVEAQRLSLERRGAVEARRPNQLPRYEPPPVAPAYAAIEELPVQRIMPAATNQELEELVITNETLNDYVSAYGGVGVSGSVSTGTRPLPPVVHNDRLPSTARTTPSQVGVEAARPAQAAGVDLYQSSLRHFNQGSYDSALTGFERFLSEGPSPDYSDNALYWIGECHYATGEYASALQSFERVVRDHPNGNKVPDSLLKIGLTYERMNNNQEANEVLSVLVETYPLTDAARRASEHLTELN